MIARVVSVFSDEGASYVGFAEDDSGTSYVMFSLADTPSEQDRRLGLDGLHFEINDQSAGEYDLVSGILADRTGLSIRLKGDDSLRIDFAPELAERSAAAQALADIATRAGVPFRVLDP